MAALDRMMGPSLRHHLALMVPESAAWASCSSGVAMQFCAVQPAGEPAIGTNASRSASSRGRSLKGRRDTIRFVRSAIVRQPATVPPRFISRLRISRIIRAHASVITVPKRLLLPRGNARVNQLGDGPSSVRGIAPSWARRGHLRHVRVARPHAGVARLDTAVKLLTRLKTRCLRRRSRESRRCRFWRN